MTKPLDLAAIKERAEKATLGPWLSSDADKKRGKRVIVVKQGALAAVHCDEDSFFHDPHGKANAAFIAASRTDIPALVAEVERLGQIMKQAKKLSRQGGEWTSQYTLCEELTRILNGGE